MKHRLVLINAEVRARAKTFIDIVPDGYECVLQEPKRNLSQNALIHAVLTELGKAIDWKWNGAEVDLDDLKTIFVGAYRKAQGGQVRFAIGIDGQPVILNWRTREMTKREASEFAELIYAWMADNLAVA